jgi:hypothetical protein
MTPAPLLLLVDDFGADDAHHGIELGGKLL